MAVSLLTRSVSVVIVVALSAGCGAFGISDQPSSADIARGETLYRLHGCSVCHGARGHGDGSAALKMDPPPRDFRDLAAFQQGTGVRDIATTIARGVLRPGRQRMPEHREMPEDPQMPAYSHLAEQDRLALAAFVVSLRGAPDK